MANKILRRVQFDGKWYEKGKEKDLAASGAPKNLFERWRIEGAISGFVDSGKPDKYETDDEVATRQEG